LIVFDVGANKGEFSEHILRHNPKSQVFAFEPNSGVCGVSLINLKCIYPERLHVNLVALGANSGSGALYGSKLMNGQLGSLVPFNTQSEGWHLHANLFNSKNSATESENVAVLAVSELAESLDQNTIDFIKIDTQGTDVLILSEFFKYFRVMSGVVEVDAGNFSEGFRYETTSNRVEDVVLLLNRHDFQITKVLPNNSRSDELNVYFSSSQKVFNETVTALKLESNPALARYWVIQGIGTSENESNQLLLRYFINKVFRALLHPKTSFRSVLLKLTK
jgi:FkbM family methyltransferase